VPFAPDSHQFIDSYAKVKEKDPAQRAVRDRVVQLARDLAEHDFFEISEVEVSMAAVSLSLHDAADQLDHAAATNMTTEQLRARAAKLRDLASDLSGIKPPHRSKIR
jgi:allophanate hydrolase subunit 1